MNLIEKQISERLKCTFKYYIRHAIEHALAQENENNILQTIINLQASLELLSKLYVLQYEGWKGIVDEKLHNSTEAEILGAIADGSLKTTPYWKSKEIVCKDIYLNEDDSALLDNFHNLRNQIMHLGITNFNREIQNEAIWFIVRIVHQLDWQDTLPLSEQYLSNSLKTLLGQELYKKLITNSCYVDEAVDRAYELFPNDVKYCIECNNEAWALNNDGYRICLVCGYRCEEGAIGFADCPYCLSKKAVVYDALNIGSNEYINGMCVSCKKVVLVSQCPICDNVFRYPGNCSYCK
jgi:hypothetical protein